MSGGPTAAMASGAEVGVARGVRALTWLSLLALLIAPWLVRVPPLLDYPNHLARLWLIAGGAAHPPLSAVYAIEWTGAWTNIGVDLLARGLGGWLGVERLGALLVGLALALPALGAIALNRALFGGVHWWHIACALPAWSTTLLAGFLNFHIGLGLALLAAAVDPRLAGGAPLRAWVHRATCAAVLIVCHPFAVLDYGALIVGLSLGPRIGALRTRPGLASAATASIAAASAIALPALIFFAAAPSVPGGQRGWPAIEWGPLDVPGRVSVLASAIRTYAVALDAPVAVALAWPVIAARRRRRLRVHGGLLLAAGALVIAALAMPQQVAGVYWINLRLPVMALLTLVAAVRPDVATRRAALAVASALFAVAIVRTGAITAIWIARQADIRAVERVLAHVPAGTAVLPLEHAPSPGLVAGAPLGRYFGSVPSYWHYPALAIPWRQAFVPTLFTAAGSQPVRVLPPWDRIAVPGGPIASVHVLSLPEVPEWIRYVRFWRERFDYVLVLNADLPDAAGPLPPLPELTLVEDAGFAKLFAVRRAGDRGPAIR